MIVRWGLAALPDVCATAGVSAPLVVASPRWAALGLPLDEVARSARAWFSAHLQVPPR